MVTVSKRIFHREGFAPAVYAPGVISGTRAIWASIGAAIAMMIVTAAAFFSGHPLIFVPPLAASAFIAFAVPRARLARPKNIIGGHLIAAVAGNLVLALFAAIGWLPTATGPASIERVVMVGLGALLGTVLMVATDMDQPPALATAAVVTIGYTQPNWWVPLTFGAGAAIVAFCSVVWNRIFFDFPPR